MLQAIRNNSQGLLAKIFIGFIILIFAIFGLDSIVGTIVNNTTTVTVNGTPIDEVTIETEAQRITQQLLSSLGAQIDISGIDTNQFREQAINNLIERELLMQAAVESGMIISSINLDRQIAQTADFQVAGTFSSERARALLASIGFTPASYRAAVQREGLLNQMITAYSTSSFATPAELVTMARISNENRNFRYIRILAGDLAQSQMISDAEITTYYEENSALFMQSERVSLQYLELDKNDLIAEITIPEEDILAQYNTEILSIQAETERRASHILLQASGNQLQAAISRAQELKARIDNGESFEELAAEFSDDTGSAQLGGDVGYTNGEAFVGPFETALRALEVGEVSAPVQTQFGVHLIKLTELTESEAPDFEESKDRIERELQDQAVDEIYLARAEELNNLSFESIDLQEPADILGLEIKTTDLFDSAGGVGIASDPGVISVAFGSEVLDGLNSELLSLSDSRSVVIRLQEHREAELKPLQEVRGEIEATLRMQKAETQARSLGETYLSNLNADQNIDNLLAVQGLEWNRGANLTRNNTGLDQEIVRLIFSLPKPENETANGAIVEGRQLANGDYVIAELLEVIPGNADDLSDEERLNLQAYLMEQEATADFSAFMAGLQARADIDR